MLKNNEILSLGEFQNNILNGIGKNVNEDEIIEDGIFKNGKLNGLGVTYDSNRNEYQICTFKEGGQIKDYRKGEDIPIKEISKIIFFKEI